ncbi:MAG: hypothetical protein ACK4HW_07965 [Roseinatronobacter sp.]
MPMDPISFWLQASVFWAKVMRQQHETYLRMLGAMVEKVPHPTAADLSEQAQAQAAPDAASVVILPEIVKPRAKVAPVAAAPLEASAATA